LVYAAIEFRVMKREEIENDPILHQSIEFAVSAIRFCEALNQQKQFVISRQLVRCATSIGANAMEAQQSESRADFVHKMKIAAKEAAETQYWLIVCEQAILRCDTAPMLQALGSINRLLFTIVSTSKQAR